jgi:hypothetical protein
MRRLRRPNDQDHVRGVGRLDEDDGQSVGLADAARGKLDTLHSEGFLAQGFLRPGSRCSHTFRAIVKFVCDNPTAGLPVLVRPGSHGHRAPIPVPCQMWSRRPRPGDDAWSPLRQLACRTWAGGMVGCAEPARVGDQAAIRHWRTAQGGGARRGAETDRIRPASVRLRIDPRLRRAGRPDKNALLG